MSGYSDTWAEFRQVVESTRKKLLKKPNYPQAINQLNSISLKMQSVICVDLFYLFLYCYYPSEICDYYTKAVKISMNLKALRLAGLTSLEAAKLMKECRNYEMAIEHAHRAIRLLDGEFFTHSQALYCLAEIHFSMSQWEQLLATVDDLWITAMKNRARTFIGRNILKDCEVITMLSLPKIHVR
uniref:Tetratricopeptide repeat protein 21B n=1 Tax=Heterorhabditis bacteriophora TaxID=37862 RepID=A0A1I7WJ40_HETBA